MIECWIIGYSSRLYRRCPVWMRQTRTAAYEDSRNPLGEPHPSPRVAILGWIRFV